jgi:hypothetical protein
MKTYLVSKGADGNKNVTQGMGERQPIASNKIEGRAKNLVLISTSVDNGWSQEIDR